MFLTRKRRNLHTISIGIVGTNNGAGVTHFAILLCNYFASKERRKTAFADLSRRRSVEVLYRVYNEDDQNGDGEKMTSGACFHMHGVDYYSINSREEIVNIIQLGYEYVVFDMGTFPAEGWEDELRRCHIRILVGNCCEWRQEEMERALEHRLIAQNRDRWVYTFFNGCEEIRRRLEKKYHIREHRIPTEEDPFMIHCRHFEALNNMLQEAYDCP